MKRPSWDFEYLSISKYRETEDVVSDFVVATFDETPPEDFARVLEPNPDVHVARIVVRPPLFWTRVHAPSQNIESITRTLEEAGIRVRYVTSAHEGGMALGAPADFSAARAAVPNDWASRPARVHAEDRTGTRWFLGPDGVDVLRSACGTGAGVRLAVIDDEARDVDALDLDAEVRVGGTEPMRGSSHGAAMVAWAVGSRGRAAEGVAPFAGIAPDASPRLYYIPKPGSEVVCLPLAIVRAVDDGADVIVCATYVEGTTSPLLDDAFEFARRLGRGGLGTAIVLPTGREISSPEGSVHASLTLGLAEPPSDARAFCIAPSGRDGGWFLWTDRRGFRKPFSNRSPAVRVAASGDDMAYPFSKDHRLGHAESSGASAIAAGVAALVLGTNPYLGVDELHAILTDSAVKSGVPPSGPFADPADILPNGCDPDRHDAKCGYGRLSALRACAAAADPVASALLTMGEEDAALRFLTLRTSSGKLSTVYSQPFAQWAARIVRTDHDLSHGLRGVMRHLRLLSGRDDRRSAQTPGALARALALLVARLMARPVPRSLAAEAELLRRAALEATRKRQEILELENACFDAAADIWGRGFVEEELPSRVVGDDPPVGGIVRSA